MERLKELEKTIGYEFSNKNLLLQAFTLQDFEVFVIKTLIREDYDPLQNKDSSENNDSEVIKSLEEKKSIWNEIRAYDFCYERLEFLGDAVLDFLAVERIRKANITNLPGKLSLLKQACVNNKSLAIIAMYYDFDRFLLLKDPKNLRKIEDLKKKQHDFIANPNLIPENDHLIKVLGDVFEAFVGALYLDTGLNIEQTREVLNRLIMSKFIDEFMKDHYVESQPEWRAQNYMISKKLSNGPPKIE